MNFQLVSQIFLIEEQEKKWGKSIFTMDDVNTIIKQDTNTAKKYIMDKVNKAKDSLKSESFRKIIDMVNKAKNSENLAFRISNFILAHPKERAEGNLIPISKL